MLQSSHNNPSTNGHRRKNYMSYLSGRLYWLLPHKCASLVSSNDKTHPLVTSSDSCSLSGLFWHYNTIQHSTISTMSLHWFLSTPLFFHPSAPNIYNINGTHLLLKVLHSATLHSLVFAASHKLVPAGYHSFTVGSSGTTKLPAPWQLSLTVTISATNFLLLVQLSGS